MNKKFSVLFAFLFLSANLFAGIFSKNLEYDNVIGLTAVESFENGKTILTVSGLCANSAMVIKKIDIQKKDSKIVMIVEASVFHSEKESGSFKHSFEIPFDVKRVVFGNVAEFEIWNAESPFKTGVLTNTPKILTGTTLALNDSQFSETRYEFTSETEGTVRRFSISYCKECDSYPNGIIYEEAETPKKFVYDSASGKLSIDSEYGGNIARISGDTYVLYNLHEVYSRTIAKAQKLKSAWAAGSRFGKIEYVFYTDGSFTGPFSFTKNNMEENTAEDFERPDKYEEINSILRLDYSALPSPRFLLHDGNKLYKVYGYLTKTERNVYLNQKLTLDEVIRLSQKRNNLSFIDFRQYQGVMIGSGLIIMQYKIDENFSFVIGGTDDNNVLYANLEYIPKAKCYIDIRDEDVKAFIEKCLELEKN